MMGNSGSVKSIRESIQQDIDYYRQRKTSISSVKLENFMTLSELHREYQWLCKQLENCGNLAFCHNDVQRGNIMVEKPSRRVRLIDFEYSEWNFRAFEFGNFFCECYIDNFWDDGNTFSLRRELFPRRERMIRVLKTYLEEMAKLKKEQSVLNEAISKEADARRRKSVSCNGKLAEENGAHPSSDKSVSSTKVEETESEFQRGGASTNGDKSFDEPLCVDREVETFYEETKIGMLCSHFYWALWGLIQEAVADIDWEYREYAAARMAEYTELKAKLVEGKWE